REFLCFPCQALRPRHVDDNQQRKQDLLFFICILSWEVIKASLACISRTPKVLMEWYTTGNGLVTFVQKIYQYMYTG
ncbi:hypothetical protein Goarm_012690, partial [Gossypium armourianum]|nr:hypothetical protein [Gossypium armourianum]